MPKTLFILPELKPASSWFPNLEIFCSRDVNMEIAYRQEFLKEIAKPVDVSAEGQCRGVKTPIY